MRSEVKKAKQVADEFNVKLEETLNSLNDMLQLYDEYKEDILVVKDVRMSVKKIAGVKTPVLDGVDYEVKDFSLFNQPGWLLDGVEYIKEVVSIALEREFFTRKMELLDKAEKENDTEGEFVRESADSGIPRGDSQDQAVLGRRGKPFQVVTEDRENPVN